MTASKNTLKTIFGYSVKPFYGLLLIGLGLCLASRISAVEKNYLFGNWMNVDQGMRGILAMQIGQQDNQILMRAWGACSPDPCKWGYYGVIAGSKRIFTGRVGSNGSLQDKLQRHANHNAA
jgi:hypothetical protein